MPLRIPTWPPQWPEIQASVVRSIRSGDWGNYLSQACQTLADDLAGQSSSTHVRLCCSGSAAVEIALRAVGVGPSDEVILSAFDYPGNFRTIELLGARPVLVDLAPDSVRLDRQQLEAAASEKVKAVIVSHLFGVAADVLEIRKACDDHGWALIEDACQVPGMRITGRLGGQAAGPADSGPVDSGPVDSGPVDSGPVLADRPAGSVGHFGALSFGGSKPLTAGNGGALLTSDPKLAARLGPLLDRPSDTMPLSPLQAAALRPQLDRLDEMNRHRRDTVAFIETEVVPKLTRWQWLSPTDPSVFPAYYKVAWAAQDESHRQRIVGESARIGLPIGEGFKSMARCSDRRCRKPVPLIHAEKLGHTLIVLDHTALLVDAEQYPFLAELLIELHAVT
jgi:dTDP-4-amino-4,6-dideoxygalactose transaminase